MIYKSFRLPSSQGDFKSTISPVNAAQSHSVLLKPIGDIPAWTSSLAGDFQYSLRTVFDNKTMEMQLRG
jgi:hypothetical protein